MNTIKFGFLKLKKGLPPPPPHTYPKFALLSTFFYYGLSIHLIKRKAFRTFFNFSPLLHKDFASNRYNFIICELKTKIKNFWT